MSGALAVGYVLQGRYRIVELIGQGGSAVVYRAERLGTSPVQSVAVKQFVETPDGVGQAQLQNEVNVLFGLTHPSLPRLYDFFEEGQTWYLVSEFIDGRSVEELLAAGEGFTPRSAAELGLQLAGVLGYLNERGIVHRDVKPENMLITREGRLKLIDFGLAGPATYSGLASQDVVGFSDLVAAPEQKAGLPTDVRADIYSVGATLYYILTGKEPQPSRKTTRTRVIDPRIGPELTGILEKCLMYEPDERYQTFAELQDALAAVVGSQRKTSNRKRPRVRELVLGIVFGGLVLTGAFFTYVRLAISPPALPPQPPQPAIQGPAFVQLGGESEVKLVNAPAGDYTWKVIDNQRPSRVMQVMTGTTVAFKPSDVGVFTLQVEGPALTAPLRQDISVGQELRLESVVALNTTVSVRPLPEYLGRDKNLKYTLVVTAPDGSRREMAGQKAFSVSFREEGAYQLQLITEISYPGAAPVTVKSPLKVVQAVKYLTIAPERILNPNPSFEALNAEGGPLDWRASRADIWDTKVALQGRRSIRFDQGGSVVMQSVKLISGREYQLSVWVKGRDLNLTKPPVVLKFRSRYSEQYVRPDITSRAVSGTFDWTTLIIDFTAPAQVSDLEIYLGYDQGSTGTLWFDYCVLTYPEG